MFPITEPALSITDIADYWSRDIRPSASSNELLSTLVSAWWLGEFRGDSIHSRLQLFKVMLSPEYRDDLGIVFIVGDDPGPPRDELPDEPLEIDLRPQIRVPSSNTESWAEAACRDAFHALAEATKRSLINIYRGFAVFLASIKLTYEEFNTWRATRGYDEPKFWKPRDQLVTPQERKKTWQAKPGKRLTATEAAVVRVMNELWPDGGLELKAKARDKQIEEKLGTRLSPRTIQRTLEKIHLV